MNKALKAVVLAAGKSTRMKSAFSKVVHKILGKEIINILIDNLIESGISEKDIVVVVGDNEAEVRKVVRPKVSYAIQAKQLGTAHALLCARDQVANFQGDLLVAVGDNPYVTAEDFKKLIANHRQTKAQCTILTARFPGSPPPYGRVIRNSKGRVAAVIEELDATPRQRQIREVNSSIYLFDNWVVFPLLDQIDNRNAKKEYYLTDVIRILSKKKYRSEAFPATDPVIAIGINNRWELQEAQKRLNERNLMRLAIDKGVTVLQPETVTIEWDVEIGIDTVIYPCSYIASGTSIGKNCRIGPFVFLKKVRIGDNERLAFEKRVGDLETRP